MATVHPLPLKPVAVPAEAPAPAEPLQKPAAALRRRSVWLWLLAAIAAIGIAALAWIYGALLVLGPVVAATPVIKTNLVQTLVASGHVETPFRVSVSSRITGVVASIPVSEGDTVAAGQTLIVLDASEARASVVQAQGQVAQAEARARQIRELTLPLAEQGLAAAKATLNNAQQIYDRAAKLAASGVGTRAALGEAAKSLDIANAQLHQAELQVFTNRSGGSGYVLAETELAQARAGLAAAKARLGYAEIKAERDGVLILRNVETGNVVQPGVELMSLSPSGDVEIVVQIDEKNLGLVAVGQDAIASADAYGKDAFPAVVAFINPAVDLQRASVEVKLKVADPPAYIRQDMTVSVDIGVARRQQVLVINAADLRDSAGDAVWVLKIDAGRAKRQAVTVGLVSAGRAEVLAGLKEGDLIVPATLAAVVDGSRVRLADTGKP
ncbi:MAG: efflux RND transporter periplasmic adaptor subunit [Aestuariivirga sp.]